MKLIASAFIPLLFLFCANGKEIKYTGCTPANQVVRAFLEISSADSVDFIRWSIILENDKYTLRCNYGIGKPNTKGFVNGGKWVEFHGTFKKEGNYYRLRNANRTLALFQVNPDLMHVVDADNSLSAGTGGWSYTLNRIAPVITDEINVTFKKPILKDSIVYQGRTPCGVPGIESVEKPCYKLKWYLVLYGDPKNNEPRGYKVLGTAWRQRPGKVGEWKIVKGKEGRIIYQLKDEDGSVLINLVKLDDNVLAFSDRHGQLLVGDEDFSYTLSRKW